MIVILFSWFVWPNPCMCYIIHIYIYVYILYVLYIYTSTRDALSDSIWCSSAQFFRDAELEMDEGMLYLRSWNWWPNLKQKTRAGTSDSWININKSGYIWIKWMIWMCFSKELLFFGTSCPLDFPKAADFTILGFSEGRSTAAELHGIWGTWDPVIPT